MRLAIVVLSLALFTVSYGEAKCPFVRYEVKGNLILPEGIDPDHVAVYLFLEGTTRTTQYPVSKLNPDRGSPSENGSFEVVVWLSTASIKDANANHQCNRVEVNADLLVVGHDIRAVRRAITFPQSRKEIRKELQAVAEIEAIEIDQLGVGTGEQVPE